MVGLTRKNYWFTKKKYGWGWTPANTQGWTVLVVYVLSIFALTPIIMDGRIGTYLVLVHLFTAALIAVAYHTGEKPRWQWGEQ